MSASTELGERAPARSNRSQLVIAALAVLVVAAIALDTKVVKIGSDEDVANEVFSPEKFGSEEFPKIQSSIEERAVDAKTLADAVVADKAAAAKQYGVPAGIGSVIPVTFTGVVGDGKVGDLQRRRRRHAARDQDPGADGSGDQRHRPSRRDRRDRVRPFHQPDRVPERRCGDKQRDEEAGARKRRHQHAHRTRPSRWSAPSPWSIPKNWLVTPVELKVQ